MKILFQQIGNDFREVHNWFVFYLLILQGITSLVDEMSENNELIDPIHGHGSQCLINLLLTGRGVNYVWDNDQDLGGLSMQTSYINKCVKMIDV